MLQTHQLSCRTDTFLEEVEIPSTKDKVTEFDFDNVKKNLKTFLKDSQSLLTMTLKVQV